MRAGTCTNMLMKADLNGCLCMHVWTNAQLWIFDKVVCWCKAVFSFDELSSLNFSRNIFQIMMHILGSLMLSATRSFFLCHSKSNIALFWLPDEHVNKTKCTALYTVGFKVWPMLSKATLLRSQALVTIKPVRSPHVPPATYSLVEKSKLLMWKTV